MQDFTNVDSTEHKVVTGINDSPFLLYDTTQRLSDSVVLVSNGKSDGLSSSGQWSPLPSSRVDVSEFSALEATAELIGGGMSACDAPEFDLDVFVAARTDDGNVVGHFCSSAMWHWTACWNGRYPGLQTKTFTAVLNFALYLLLSSITIGIFVKYTKLKYNFHI